MTDKYTRASYGKKGVQFIWDATSIELAQTCLRKYSYKNIRGLHPRNLSVHLLFGQHYATALERFHKYRAKGLSIEDALADVVGNCMKDTWNYEENVPLVFDHAAKTRFNLLRSIIWYITEFSNETEQGIKTHFMSNGDAAVELSFMFELDDDLMLCGHLDTVVDFGEDQFVMDQKTTGGTVTTYFFNQFSPSNQMSLYTYAGQIILKSPIRGVIIDGAQIAAGFTRFGRGFVHRTPKQLEEWLKSAKYTINLAREATAAKEFPMNLASCGNYGGCEFRNVCAACPSVRENYIKAEFTEGQPWDPAVRR